MRHPPRSLAETFIRPATDGPGCVTRFAGRSNVEAAWGITATESLPICIGYC